MSWWLGLAPKCVVVPLSTKYSDLKNGRAQFWLSVGKMLSHLAVALKTLYLIDRLTGLALVEVTAPVGYGILPLFGDYVAKIYSVFKHRQIFGSKLTFFHEQTIAYVNYALKKLRIVGRQYGRFFAYGVG
jgi:hypothetical protein